MAFNDPLFQLGMDLTRSSTTHANHAALERFRRVHTPARAPLPSGENLMFNLGVRSALTPVAAPVAAQPARAEWLEREGDRRSA